MTVTEQRSPDTATTAVRPQMHVRKRNGDQEVVDVGKIVRAVERVSGDLLEVDPLRVATRTISGLYDGATTEELARSLEGDARSSRSSVLAGLAAHLARCRLGDECQDQSGAEVRRTQGWKRRQAHVFSGKKGGSGAWVRHRTTSARRPTCRRRCRTR